MNSRRSIPIRYLHASTVASGTISRRRFKVSILEGFTPMAPNTRLHIELFAAITVLSIARSVAICTSDSRRRVNPMMEHDMVRQVTLMRPGLFRQVHLHFFFRKFVVHREPVAIHTVRHRRHIRIRRGTCPRMAGGTVQANRITVNGVVKRNRGHSPFRNCRFFQQKISEEHREHNNEKDDHPTEQSSLQKPRHFNARKPHIGENRIPLKGD